VTLKFVPSSTVSPSGRNRSARRGGRVNHRGLRGNNVAMPLKYGVRRPLPADARTQVDPLESPRRKAPVP